MTILEAKYFLNDLPNSFFFSVSNCEYSLIGSICGKLTYINTKKLGSKDVSFTKKLRQTGADVFIVSDLDDLTEIAKTKGWFDGY